MRTKTLLLAAAFTAAGIAAIQAQSNVYSLNVVGYYSIVVPGSPAGTPPGAASRLKLATLQLQQPGVAPTLNTMLTNISGDGILQIHTWTVPTGWDIVNEYLGGADGWETDRSIPLGAGFFLKNPTDKPMTVTVVGEVPQGALVNTWTVNPANGFNPRGSQVPQSGRITDDLGFNTVGSAIYTFNNQNPSWYGPWELLAASPNPTEWENPGPQTTLAVGEAVMVKGFGATQTWNRNFTVQ